MQQRIQMPQLGESVVEGTIAKWLVKPGDRVGRDQPLAEIETDKANADLPSPIAGIVRELLVQEGARVGVGADLVVVETDGAGAPAEPPPIGPEASAGPVPVQLRESEAAEPHAPPSVRKLARERGVDLSRVSGSGGDGRITRDDVLKAAQNGADQAATITAQPVPVATPGAPPARKSQPPKTATQPPKSSGTTPGGFYRVPEVKPEPDDEVIPFDRRRRIIAEHMVYSKQTAPHVVCVAEADLARVTRERKKLPEPRPSFTAYVAAATVQALRAVPRLNAHVPQAGDQVVVRKAIHLGIAVDVEAGLVVPVIRNADRLSLAGIAEAIRELAAKARDKALRPDDLAGATFTVSNPGPRGNLWGAAIINQPQVGILRMGEIEKRPTVVTTPDGDDAIVVHPKMYLALSYDHRVVDGVMANDFLRRIKDLIEAGHF
jgi:pyruvate/2-oxoglutarate dehydrogenase complex dihydrolipoamide acyltransferase (E2) component